MKQKVRMPRAVMAALVMVGVFGVSGKSFAVPIEYDFVSLFSSNVALPSFHVTFPSINNSGTVAYVRPGGLAFGFDPVLMKNSGSGETLVEQGTLVSGVPHADINDNGDILVTNNSGSLLRFNGDGSATTTLADITSDIAGFGNFASINNLGQAAALVTTDGNSAFQIRRFGGASDTPGTGTVIDTVLNPPPVGETNERFSLGDPDINDSGVVAYKATDAASGHEKVFTGDGTGAPAAAADLSVLNGSSGSEASINNSGDVAAGQAVGVLKTQGGVVNIIDDGTTGNFQGTGRVGFNNFGGVVFAATVRNDFGDATKNGQQGLFTGADHVDDKVIQTGDSVFGAAVNEIRFFGDGTNDLGQVTFLMSNDLEGPSNTVTSYVVRADPRGSKKSFALLPDRFVALEKKFEFDLAIRNGLGVIKPIFLDPIVAVGYEFEIGEGGENFASVIVPDALPNGDGTFTVEFFDGAITQSMELLAGVTFDFTDFIAGGVDAFKILDIDIAEMLNPNEPFVAGLTFVASGFDATLTMTAITVDTDAGQGPGQGVPEPGTLALFGAGIAGFGLMRRRRKVAA